MNRFCGKWSRKSMEKMDKKGNRQRLKYWQDRFEKAQSDYADEKDAMNWREKLYNGTKEIKPAPGAQRAKQALHVRNIAAEMIETQVSSAIPMPKVQAIRQQDEILATKIENFLRNEIDRLPFEELNDQDERTTYIQGGDHFLVEWDNTKRTHCTQGMLEVNLQHPKTVTPQPGVLTGIEDMDYFFVEIPRTKDWILENYGIDMEHETEEDPDLRGVDDAATSDDIVDQVYAFYRNRDSGGIGLFSWVNDTPLDDDEDYQARRQKCCSKCGAPGDGVICAYCGSTEFTEGSANEGQKEGRVIDRDIVKSDGSIIPAMSPVRNELGEIETVPDLDPVTGYMSVKPVMEQTVIPWYKPNVYPLVLRKNVSTFGKYLGGSDIDKIEDQQESIKKMETKALEKMLKGGSIVALPAGLPINNTDEEMKRVDVSNPADLQKIGVFNIQVDASGDIALCSNFYEEARNTLGITDSFQGKRDSTATSGTAKQFAAAQSAGRLESKRVMKDAAYARLYELVFKFAIAYMDAPQDIAFSDGHGGRIHDVFNPFDFVEQDAAGEWYWNDQFLFSVDSSASLVTNREALWQETRMNYTQGCYGQTGTPQALYAFWRNMAQYHYPGAADMMQLFEEQMAMQQQMPMQAAAMMPQGGSAGGGYDAAAAIAQMDQQAQAQQILNNGGGRQA